ncbi:MAG: TIGR00730 family Rossman fold protein [Rhodovarius sp.]|nr:TIGR00730 family Rossman fold protein [Rhodovarius sp.]MCX7931925.1 TIGR00730 family Rossman fold protein [Rhodovarius sp.]MDW8314452.1 TIGR00730 family Rossman fold protein [Rhodovarius sp.]
MSGPRLRRVCVFCGASLGRDPAHAELARALGQTIGRRGLSLVYGGGRAGLMGVVADAALEAGAEVWGIIPVALQERELQHTGIQHLEVVPDMHTRKARMNALSDGFVVLPGGIGTLEEAVEIQSWSQLGFHRKGIVYLDRDGYWDDFFTLTQRMVDAGYLRPDHRAIAIRAHSPEEALDALERWEPTAEHRWAQGARA